MHQCQPHRTLQPSPITMATAAAAVRGCFAATSGRSAVAAARSAVRAQAGALRTVPTRSLFGGLFGGKKEKREVGATAAGLRAGCSGGSGSGFQTSQGGRRRAKLQSPRMLRPLCCRARTTRF